VTARKGGYERAQTCAGYAVTEESAEKSDGQLGISWDSHCQARPWQCHRAKPRHPEIIKLVLSYLLPQGCYYATDLHAYLPYFEELFTMNCRTINTITF